MESDRTGHAMFSSGLGMCTQAHTLMHTSMHILQSQHTHIHSCKETKILKKERSLFKHFAIFKFILVRTELFAVNK